MTRVAALLIVFAIAPASVAQKSETAPFPISADKEIAAREKSGREAVARLWLDLAAYALEREAKATAETALQKAKASGDASKRGEALAVKAARLGPDAAVPAVAERESETSKRVAEHLEKLAALDVPPADEARFEAYLFDAIALGGSTKKRIELFRKLADKAVEKGRFERAGRLFVRVRDVDPEGYETGRYARLEIESAKRDVVLIRSKDHPMFAYVSLPKEWNDKKSWPILVAVEGAGCNFQGACRGFRAAAAATPFIVLTPVGLTNTNALDPALYPLYPKSLLEEWNAKRFEFDAPGLDAVLKEVRERYRGEEKISMTGFSGGGLLTYWLLLRRPEMFAAAAPACANFQNDLRGTVTEVPGGGPPILLLVGEKDPHREKVHGKFSPGIDGQTDLAEAALKERGFTRLERRLLPGLGHDACAAAGVAFFEKVRTGK